MSSVGQKVNHPSRKTPINLSILHLVQLETGRGQRRSQNRSSSVSFMVSRGDNLAHQESVVITDCFQRIRGKLRMPIVHDRFHVIADFI